MKITQDLEAQEGKRERASRFLSRGIKGCEDKGISRNEAEETSQVVLARIEEQKNLKKTLQSIIQ